MSEKSIKIRYNAGEPLVPPLTPSSDEKKAKRKQTPAQKEALEKARQALLEKKQKEKEAKAKLKEQEKDIDNVILANASRGQELRKRMAELQKELEEIEVGEPLGGTTFGTVGASTPSALGGWLVPLTPSSEP